MAAEIPSNSVGLVKPLSRRFDSAFVLQSGAELPGIDLVYETYGSLNEKCNNAILVCHALSGHHHAAGYHSAEDTKPGWWDNCIGPGKPIDTDHFYVLSLNNLGGCHGTTGPTSINPKTGDIYGPSFPTVTVKDWVRTQRMLAKTLGIDKFAAIIGGSLGGMQAMQWAIDYPDQVEHALLIACTPKLSAQNIAFNEIARFAISSDPEFNGGHYQTAGVSPERGLGLARMVGHVTYLSDDSMGDKFGRELKSGDIALGQDVEFQVESYLHYQGESFSKLFDANTYILMTRALDYFDPAREFDDDLVRTLANANAKFFVASFTSDWRFAPERSDTIVDALIAAGKDVISTTIESTFGHDSFLLPIPRYFSVLRAYMDRIARECAL
ncbi:MAG: homoserine O-acetyltransferase [Pseudomonadota bacterium]|nr:homoserine O-acetyltransferase [Pseudomonadota bacterium]